MAALLLFGILLGIHFDFSINAFIFFASYLACLFYLLIYAFRSFTYGWMVRRFIRNEKKHLAAKVARGAISQGIVSKDHLDLLIDFYPIALPPNLTKKKELWCVVFAIIFFSLCIVVSISKL